MRSVLDIRVQKLFLLATVLKVGSAFLGWLLHDPWILGFALPLGFMAAYIVLGMKRHDTGVSDEKFADTCYYLGFIFTITSIIFSLLDLPHLGSTVRIQDIAVRFGAAMVSTVAGLIVRVYLVSFKRDVADAIQDAESALIEASQDFREHLVIALEKLKDFESEVGIAAQTTVERVSLQIEALSRHHADKLTEFFADLTARNEATFSRTLENVQGATLQLAQSFDRYANGLGQNLASIQTQVDAFTLAVTDRLRTTEFPDDFFARHLQAPMTLLHGSANDISEKMQAAAFELSEASAVLGNALGALKHKASGVEGALDKVVALTQRQAAVLDAAQGQVSVLGQLTLTLSSFDATLVGVLEGLQTSNGATLGLVQRVESAVADSADTRHSLDASLAVIGQHASAALGRIDQTVEQFQLLLRQMSSLDSAMRSQTADLKKFAEQIKDIKVNVVMGERSPDSRHAAAKPGAPTGPGAPLAPPVGGSRARSAPPDSDAPVAGS